MDRCTVTFAIKPIDRKPVPGLADTIVAASREYFARGRLIETALEIAMTYYGLAPWRMSDRRRIVIEEQSSAPSISLLVRQTIRIRIDERVVWSLEWEPVPGRDGLQFRAGAERWHGRCAALNVDPPALP